MKKLLARNLSVFVKWILICLIGYLLGGKTGLGISLCFLLLAQFIGD